MQEMKKKSIKYLAVTLFFIVCLMVPSFSQRIGFGLYTTDGILLDYGSVDELDFNAKQPVIVEGNLVSITLNDDCAAVIMITARADLDVSVSVDAPSYLYLDEENQIPLSIGMSYCNMGVLGEEAAKQQAVNVPAGFTDITFQMLRRNSEPPGPPPSPVNSGSQAMTVVAYIFLYGILGTVPETSSAGEYTGIINIYIEYSTYN
jgi:hypothetical protein